MLNYYRSFIPRLAEIASSLYALTGANVRWVWSEEHEKSFSTLRDILTSDMVLAFPQWDKPFFVEVDGSGCGVGAILSQEDATGKLRPLAYYSSGLTATQRNYSASEIECWALISATRKWNVYVSAAPEVVLISDHNPLTWLRRQRDPRRKFARWIAELECLNYTIVYRKGVNHAAPDFLSRMKSDVDRGANDDIEHFERHIYAVENDILGEIKTGQREDPSIVYATHQLRTDGKVTKGRYKSYGGLKVENGVLKRKGQIVVPGSMRWAVFEREHSVHHAGVHKTYGLIRERYFWVGMFKDVQTMCTACDVCQKNKRAYTPKETMQEYETGDTAPRSTIAIDVATLPRSRDGYRYLLVIVDLFSRYVELVPLKDQTADSVCSAVRSEWIHRHGPPQRIITDQGRNVDGQLMSQLCDSFGIEKRRSSPYHPEGDGLAERTIQTVKQILRCKLQDRQLETEQWPLILSEVRSNYNSLPNNSTKFEPNELMYGVRFRSPAGVSLGDPADTAEQTVGPLVHSEETQFRLSQLHQRAAQNSSEARASSKLYYDRDKRESDIQPGDYVYLRRAVRNSSLDPLYDGPFLVIVRRGVNVLLKMESGDQNVHLNRCKKCVNRELIPDSRCAPTAPSVVSAYPGTSDAAAEAPTQPQEPGPSRRGEGGETSRGVVLNYVPPSVAHRDNVSELGDSAQAAAERRYPLRTRRQPQFFTL